MILVVDIQKKFSKNMSTLFLHKVKKFLEKNKNETVVSLLDAREEGSGDFIPAFLEKQSHCCFYKFYNNDFINFMIKKNNLNFDPLKKIYEIDGGYIVQTAVGLDFIDDDFYSILLEEKSITLIGGHRRKCLLKVKEMLVALGKKVTIIEPLTYKETLFPSFKSLYCVPVQNFNKNILNFYKKRDLI